MRKSRNIDLEHQFIQHYINLHSVMLSEGAILLLPRKTILFRYVNFCSGHINHYNHIYNSVDVGGLFGDRCQCRSLHYPPEHSDCL